MARVAIVSYDVQTLRGKSGGVGAFTTRWARLLRAAGEDVTIIMVRTDWEPMTVDMPWKARYQAWGIGLIELQAPLPLPTRWPEVATMRVSELAAPVLRNFDIVYLQDWGNAGFHLLRERRYARDQGPVCVTVLHGPSEWELSSNGRYPDLPAHLHLAFQERYGAKHSDFVVSPSRYMVRQLQGLGWELSGEPEVLGLPMPEPAHGEIGEIGEIMERSEELRTIVYFGRIEERKGIRIFVKALEHLASQLEVRPQVVLLGAAQDLDLLTFALRELETLMFAVTHLPSLDSEGAMAYLRGCALETLCVVPSSSDNHPYSIVEASLIPGLNLIACRGGGVPEILGDADAQLSEPFPRALAAKMLERLRGPLGAGELALYDWQNRNERWMEFHRKALASAEARTPKQRPAKRASVDVCIANAGNAAFLGQLVEALQRQTEKDFHVIVVSEGSGDAELEGAFAEFAAKTAAQGWTFVLQEKPFAHTARNHAAAFGRGELLLFLDADDVPAAHAVARLREAITFSGDDALVCGSFLFASDKQPYNPVDGEIEVEAEGICVPLGMDLVGGMVEPSAFGGSMFMVRRSAFEAIGGFRERRGAGHEVWAFCVRLALAGYKVDVVSDLLQFDRQAEGSPARTPPAESSPRLFLEAYEERLRAAGLPGTALALAGLDQRGKEIAARIRTLTAKLNAPEAQPS